MFSNEPNVAIVIVTYNKVKTLLECLSSLKAIKYTTYHIIVVDNNSTDDTSFLVQKNHPYVTLLRSKKNTGYTGGNNLGIQLALKSNYDYILFLNDDIIVDPNFLSHLVNIAGSDRCIGLVCPKLLCFETPNRLYKEYGKYNFYLGINVQPLQGIELPQEIDLVPGASFLAKMDIFRKIGLMDENFFLYFDEGDICYRIKKIGLRIIYEPSSIVFHKVSASFSGRVNPIVLYYSTRNELLLARKHLNPLLFFPLWVPRYFIRIIDYWIKYRNLILIRAMLRGFLDFTKNDFGGPKSL